MHQQSAGNDVLPFSEATQRWFDSSFAQPTEAQVGAWKSIARGNNTLVVAPTGSGKTLSAFLWSIDKLVQERSEEADEKVRILYISPMKALGVDVEKNLRSPLAGITQAALALGLSTPSISVGVRSGDTSAQERRRLAKHPPDILITTPESLYLMLTSEAGRSLSSVQTVIIDEIHALAGNKRGAHLALSLERLDDLLPTPAQRIGLSATVKPPREVARFLGGEQKVTIVAPQAEPHFNIRVEVPVPDMTQPPMPEGYDSEDYGGEHRLGSMWPSIENALYRHILSVHSTIIFANSRRLAERLTQQINAIHEKETGSEEPLAQAHHGSVSKEQRENVEEGLKSGRIRCVVSTSSLELGIDMGLVDQVILMDPPPSVASGLQRIGRAGHHVGGISQAIIFPTHRSKLLETAAVVQRMRSGQIEDTQVLTNPLDILAQHTVAAVSMKDWDVDEWYRTVVKAAPYQSLPRTVFDATLDLLAGKYPSTEFAQLRPRLIWDRTDNLLSARPGSQRLAVTQGGTIPDRGLFRVVTAGEDDSRSRVGELDEEMVYESRVGEVFTLGTTSWRIKEITKDTVEVLPAFGVPGKMPFWRGDSASRPFQLGQGIGELIGRLDHSLVKGSDDSAVDFLRELGFDDNAVTNTLAYVTEQREVAGTVPTDATLLVEQTKDDVGDWRLVLESPLGLAVHAPWALAINARVRQLYGIDGSAIASNDGIIVRLPDTDDDVPGASLFAFDPDELRQLVLDEVSDSALFASRFRECAARALILGGGKPGKRSPLWQQRQRSARLLEVATRYPTFPIVLEALRECLQDVYDVDALVNVHQKIRDGRIRLQQNHTDVPGPFAQSLLFGYVGAFMYEGDTPAGERRLAALSVDPELLRELLGDTDLSQILEPDAITQVHDELQKLTPSRWLRGPEGVVDLLRLLGPMSIPQLSARLGSTATPDEAITEKELAEALSELIDARRVIVIRIAGSEVYATIEDAGVLQQALGIALPMGVPSAFTQPQPDALRNLLVRYGANRGPFTAQEAAHSFGLGTAVVASELRILTQERLFIEGVFSEENEDSQPQWIHRDVLRRIRGRSIALLRGSVEAVPQHVYAAFLQEWQGIGTDVAGAEAVEMALDVLTGLTLPASTWESLVLPARVEGYQPDMLDSFITSGEFLWAGEGQLSTTDGWVSFHHRDTAPLTLPQAEAPSDGLEQRIIEVLTQHGALFAPAIMEYLRAANIQISSSDLSHALWSLVWKSVVTTDNIEALRVAVKGKRAAQKTSPHRRRPRRMRTSLLREMAPALSATPTEPSLVGRWSLLPSVDPDAPHRFVATLGLLLDRYAVVSKGVVNAESVEGGFSRIYQALVKLEESGKCRRGYLIQGLGGAQFALSHTVDRLREFAENLEARAQTGNPHIVVLSATDPANPYGAVLPWPDIQSGSDLPEIARPRRNPGALVVLVDGRAVFYVERGGRTAVDLLGEDTTEEDRAVYAHALARALIKAQLNAFTLESINGIAVSQSPWEPALLEAGFERKPRGLIWRKKVL